MYITVFIGENPNNDVQQVGIGGVFGSYAAAYTWIDQRSRPADWDVRRYVINHGLTMKPANKIPHGDTL